jgi:Protein of unknown function (DUF2934)
VVERKTARGAPTAAGTGPGKPSGTESASSRPAEGGALPGEAVEAAATPGKPAAARTASRKPAAAGTSPAGPAAKAPARAARRPTTSAETRLDLIREAAYFIAERRGFEEGDPLADWIAAEAEVDARLAAEAPPRARRAPP